jgi:AraC-like DNA-binding protein
MDRNEPDHHDLAGAPPSFKMLRFSTEDFPENKRIAAYRDIFGTTIIKHDIERVGDSPFYFEADMWSLPGLGLASSHISPCRRWHGPQHVESDDLILGIGLSGGCVLQHCDREAVIGAGEAVLTSCAHPAEVLIATPSRPISIRIPYSILASRIPGVGDLLARRIPLDADGLVLLRGYVEAIRRVELAKPKLSALVVDHIYDLVSLILGAKGDVRRMAEARGVRAVRRSALLREIERHSGDPGLSAVTIALRLGVTPRYVHLLLEETGRSFTHHVLERRLEKAAALLRDPARGHQKISDIAAEAGFTDLSYFNRSFRHRFDATPSDIREAARRGE